MGPTLSIKYTTSNTQSPRGNKYSLLYSDLVFPPKTHLKTCFPAGVDINFKYLAVALHLLTADEMLPGESRGAVVPRGDAFVDRLGLMPPP